MNCGPSGMVTVVISVPGEAYFFAVPSMVSDISREEFGLIMRIFMLHPSSTMPLNLV
jgi:hypothetical protein